MIAEAGLPSSQSRQLATIVHLAGLANFIFLFAGLIVTVVLFFTNSQDRFVRDNAREAVNMQITCAIWTSLWLGAYLIVFIGNFARMLGASNAAHRATPPDTAFFATAFGSMGLILIGSIVTVIFCCIGASAANRGRVYRYPIAIRFLREPQA